MSRTEYYRANQTSHTFPSPEGINIVTTLQPHPEGRIIVPRTGFRIYTLYVDPNRRFKTMKERLLKPLLTLAEVLSN